jgi:hypothetical protein
MNHGQGADVMSDGTSRSSVAEDETAIGRGAKIDSKRSTYSSGSHCLKMPSSSLIHYGKTPNPAFIFTVTTASVRGFMRVATAWDQNVTRHPGATLTSSLAAPSSRAPKDGIRHHLPTSARFRTDRRGSTAGTRRAWPWRLAAMLHHKGSLLLDAERWLTA